jgi:predicted phosphoadenosine phosphosulfate sulfurtransferase
MKEIFSYRQHGFKTCNLTQIQWLNLLNLYDWNTLDKWNVFCAKFIYNTKYFLMLQN